MSELDRLENSLLAALDPAKVAVIVRRLSVVRGMTAARVAHEVRGNLIAEINSRFDAVTALLTNGEEKEQNGSSEKHEPGSN